MIVSGDAGRIVQLNVTYEIIQLEIVCTCLDFRCQFCCNTEVNNEHLLRPHFCMYVIMTCTGLFLYYFCCFTYLVFVNDITVYFVLRCYAELTVL